MDFEIKEHKFHFKNPGGTSRGILYDKDSWYVLAREAQKIVGIGECSLIERLSPDDPEQVARMLQKHLDSSTVQDVKLDSFPAVQFALETFRKSQNRTDPFALFSTSFTHGAAGIPINGLIWMGAKSTMLAQIKEKIESGFTCIKLKIGAIDFEDELALLRYIRQEFSKEDIELRVDANGAFSTEHALDFLNRLAVFDLHSIEQPIMPGQWESMAELCASTPLPIALDEELIGICNRGDKEKMLQIIQPQFIILKPSLLGGLSAANEWIDLAQKYEIGWWATSALEGNVGLNAIAQWTSTFNLTVPQGLGTGGLYTNNIQSPLVIRNGSIWYDPEKSWDLTFFNS